MAQARDTRATGEAQPRRRSRLEGHRALLWIVALALAIFVVVFLTSPKETADPVTGAPPGEIPADAPR